MVLPAILQSYASNHVCNADKSGLLFRGLPNRGHVFQKNGLEGGTGEIFSECLKEWDKELEMQKRSICLLIDKRPLIQPTYVALHRIAVKFLPSNTTSVMQLTNGHENRKECQRPLSIKLTL